MNLGAKLGGKVVKGALIAAVPLLIGSSVILSTRIADRVTRPDKPVLIEVGEQEFQVFKVSYTNEEGHISVMGAGNNAVVAPGSSNESVLRLKNVDDVAVDYTLTPQIAFTSEYQIPIVARLINPNGRYMAGSEDEWVDIAKLNDVTPDSGVIGKEEAVAYTFQWKWDFEGGDDDYDTLLAQKAKDENIGLTLTFTTQASANMEIEDNGGFVDSGALGDTIAGVVTALLLAAVTVLAIALVQLLRTPPIPPIPPTPPVTPKTPPTPPPASSSTGGEAKQKKTGKTAAVNLDVISAMFAPGEQVNLTTLKARGLADPTAKRLKILAGSGKPLDKPLIVHADSVSAQARVIIMAAGGTII